MKICQTVSDRPKIIEKFSQPAGENGHVLLPGYYLTYFKVQPFSTSSYLMETWTVDILSHYRITLTKSLEYCLCNGNNHTSQVLRKL